MKAYSIRVSSLSVTVVGRCSITMMNLPMSGQPADQAMSNICAVTVTRTVNAGTDTKECKVVDTLKFLATYMVLALIMTAFLAIACGAFTVIMLALTGEIL